MSKVMLKKTKIYVGEYGPIIVGENGQLTYGDVIRYTRKLHKYHPDHVAVLYGKITEGKPVTGRHILRMEQTDSFFPKEPKRRWVLAKLLDVPLGLIAALELGSSTSHYESRNILVPHPPTAVDIKEYYSALENYQTYGHLETIEVAVNDIKDRIDRLHDTVLYVKAEQKQQMLWLLCGYQLLIADIAQDQHCYKAAKKYLTNTIILAQDNKCYDIETIALLRREAFYDDKGDCKAALCDFLAIDQLPYSIALHFKGKSLAIAGRSKAYLSQDASDLKGALQYLDKAEKMIKTSVSNDILFSTAFDPERYCLDRASALMASPLKKLRAPDKAQEYLIQAAKQSNIDTQRTRCNRSVYSDLIQAKIYNDQGYYPVAATTAENALDTLNKLQSRLHLNDIESLLNDIKKHDPHGLEVASLELELMKMQQPYLFN